VIALTHPSQFIHTHHPRRGSMTPLGLHVISPVPPLQLGPPSPVRSLGFSPVPHPIDPYRRGSAASTCSTLTQSRPLAPSSSHPPGFNRERRRSSLTPSLPTLAAATPTRAHVSGKLRSRPSSSDGHDMNALHARTRTDGARHGPNSSPLAPRSPEYIRRGSLPHLGYPQRQWNPSLPPQRASIVDEIAVDSEYRFGAAPSTAAAALRSSDASRRSSITGKRKEDMDVFEQAEADEADKQRKAFLAATYGDDGKRARERLSIGGPSAGIPTPSPSLRRQSLMLWERLNMAKNVEVEQPAVLTPSSAPPPVTGNLIGNESLVDSRRGSLPVAIPGGGLGRSPVRRVNFGQAQVAAEEEDEGEDEDEDEEDDGDQTEVRRVSFRPTDTDRLPYGPLRDHYRHYYPCLILDHAYSLPLWPCIEQITYSLRATSRLNHFPILYHLLSIPPRRSTSRSSISTSSWLDRVLNWAGRRLFEMHRSTRLRTRCLDQSHLLQPCLKGSRMRIRSPSLWDNLMTSMVVDEAIGRFGLARRRFRRNGNQ
jgi:hypothetical protein